jgi:hypothetical protein
MGLPAGTKGLPLDGSILRDKWSLLLEVDADYTVGGGLETFF